MVFTVSCCFCGFLGIRWFLVPNNLAMGDVGSPHLPADVLHDSCRLEYIEIVPLNGDIDDACTTKTEHESEVQEEILPLFKLELDYVFCVI